MNLLTASGKASENKKTQNEFPSRKSIELKRAADIFVTFKFFLYPSRRNAVASTKNHRLMPEIGIRHVFAHSRIDILSDVLLGAVAYVQCSRQRGHTDTGQAGRTAGRQRLHATAGPTGVINDAIVFYCDQHATDINCIPILY